MALTWGCLVFFVFPVGNPPGGNRWRESVQILGPEKQLQAVQVRTVCCDPGFLASKTRAPRCASAAAPLLCLWPWRNRALGSEVRRPTYMDTELQPIGWQLEEEVEDPGRAKSSDGFQQRRFYKLKPSTPWGFLWVCASNGDTVHLSRSESWVYCG